MVRKLPRKATTSPTPTRTRKPTSKQDAESHKVARATTMRLEAERVLSRD